jgi:NADH dehydrogenase
LTERLVRESGMECGIVRPTLVFAPEDILLNNIAWVLRTFPLFVIAGDGSYRIQPVSAEDVADICVDVGRADYPREIDAAGPETYTYGEIVQMMRAAVGSKARVVHLPPSVTVALGKVAGVLKHDTLLTRQELTGLMAEKLVSAEQPLGTRSFADWLDGCADQIGRTYQSELARNWRAPKP